MKKLILSLSLFSLGAYGLTTTEYGSKNLASEVYAQTKKDLSPSLSKLEAYYAQKLTKTGLSKEQKENLQKALEFAKNYHLLKMDKFKQDRIAYLKSIYANGKQKAGESYPEVKEKSQKLVQVAQGLKSGVPLKVENNIDVILTSTKAAEKAEADKLAAAKAEADKLAAAKVEADKLAAAKVEADKLAAAKAEADKLAAAKAEADKIKINKYNQLAMAYGISCALLENSLFCWGMHVRKQIFGINYDFNNRHETKLIDNFDSIGVVKKIVLSFYGYCVLTENKRAECRHVDSSKRLTSNSLNEGVDDIEVSGEDYCLVKKGQLYCDELKSIGTKYEDLKKIEGALEVSNLKSLDRMYFNLALNMPKSAFCYNVKNKFACHGDLVVENSTVSNEYLEKPYFFKDSKGSFIENAKLFSTNSIYNCNDIAFNDWSSGIGLVGNNKVYTFCLSSANVVNNRLRISKNEEVSLENYSQQMLKYFLQFPHSYNPLDSLNLKTETDVVKSKKWKVEFADQASLIKVRSDDDEFSIINYMLIKSNASQPKDSLVSKFAYLPFFKWSDIHSVAFANASFCALLKNNEVYCLGRNNNGTIGERFIYPFYSEIQLEEGISNFSQFKKIKINEKIEHGTSFDTCKDGQLRFEKGCMNYGKKFFKVYTTKNLPIIIRKDINCKESISIDDPKMLTGGSIIKNKISNVKDFNFIPEFVYSDSIKIFLYPSKDLSNEQGNLDIINKLDVKADGLVVFDPSSCTEIQTTKSESIKCDWEEKRICRAYVYDNKSTYLYK